MDRTQELIQQYEQAENQIRKEIEKEPGRNKEEYERYLSSRVTTILAGLYLETEAWSSKHIPKIYNEGVQQAQRSVNAQY